MKINAKLEAADAMRDLLNLCNTNYKCDAHTVGGEFVANYVEAVQEGDCVILAYSNGQRFAVRVKALGRKAGA